MSSFQLRINGALHALDLDPATPLLWALRDTLNMTATKFGCGIGQCGCCTVLVNGAAVRSCQIPASSLQGAEITTIEGLSESGDHPIQQAWKIENTPQCGYCQAGQIMSTAALLQAKPKPTDEDIDSAMTGNLCRCGTYKRIRKSIHRAAASLQGEQS